MNCELISVGTEILLGDIVNTNAQYLSKRLADMGINVMFQHTVGDNEERLKAALESAFSKSDAVITTGGLGPTPDDLTKEVCAEFFGFPLENEEKSLESIKSYFKNKNTPMAKSNEKQAMMPTGSIILENKNGTAPGCIMEKDGKIIVVLPGPPREMKPMFEEGVVPYLQQFTSGVIKSHSIRTFGIGESSMAEKVNDLFDSQNPTVAPYAKSGEALLRVTAKAESEQEAERMLTPVVEEIKSRFGELVYGIDVQSIEEATVALLKEKSLTVAVAESCTAGLIAKRITDISGASEIFGCGIVSYSNGIKHKILGVEQDKLDKYGAVSPIVAAQMALGAKKVSGADIAASVTGIAGPESDETGKEVGLIYIAVTDGEKVRVKEIKTGHSKGSDCRDYNRTIAASNVINEIRLFAQSYPDIPKDSEDVKQYINSFKRECEYEKYL
ncbi:MAG: competence/damage-inducible protein A [Faecalibacterium sp.]|nr:competence/damage-inducible protein A [Ruminococcus sp.]MCM1392566.1 competence/damage-inducible protein A [Ruminococcus sp.]MCM1485641.1 competence/damage-inducible protein A [Faecalibacterium sp.]